MGGFFLDVDNAIDDVRSQRPPVAYCMETDPVFQHFGELFLEIFVKEVHQTGDFRFGSFKALAAQCV